MSPDNSHFPAENTSLKIRPTNAKTGDTFLYPLLGWNIEIVSYSIRENTSLYHVVNVSSFLHNYHIIYAIDLCQWLC